MSTATLPMSSASESVSGLKAKFTEGPDGTIYAPNGTPVGKAEKKAKAKTSSKIKKKETSSSSSSSSSISPKAKGKAKKTSIKAVATQNGRVIRSVGKTSLPVGDRRLTVIKALRKANADHATSGLTAEKIAEKTGLTRFDVYGQLYHTHHLQVSGLVKQAKLETSRGLVYYLTAKGKKADDAAIRE